MDELLNDAREAFATPNVLPARNLFCVWEGGSFRCCAVGAACVRNRGGAAPRTHFTRWAAARYGLSWGQVDWLGRGFDWVDEEGKKVPFLTGSARAAFEAGRRLAAEVFGQS